MNVVHLDRVAVAVEGDRAVTVGVEDLGADGGVAIQHLRGRGGRSGWRGRR